MRFRLLCKNLTGVALWLSLFPCGADASAKTGALRAEFDEVRLENLAIGKTYFLSQLTKSPLVIHNSSQDTIEVGVKILIPAHHDLPRGVLAVPDIHWVHLNHSHFVLPSGESVQPEVQLTLPYDPEITGKTFQVDIWSYQVAGDSAIEDRGQRHRLWFTVEMDYRDDTEDQFSLIDLRPWHTPR